MILFRLIYTLLLCVASVLAAPLWVWKMKKRGGWGTGLIERLGVITPEELEPYKGADYYHAISVGEVAMAIKVIKECQKLDASYRAVIAVTTATGHEIARLKAPENTHLIYAPLDFPTFLKKAFRPLKPRQIVLVDSELWPNMLHYAQKHGIPVKIINGRLSERSYNRFLKVSALTKRLLSSVTTVCTDGEIQVARWQHLGIPEERIYDVGSLKFDFASPPLPPSEEFHEMVESLGSGKPTIILSSTHPGEEKLLAELLKDVSFPFRLIAVPRHAERREEVSKNLQSIGYHVILRSQFKTPKFDPLLSSVLLVDTTGELSRWLQLADLVIMGKGWIKKGGQNPFESAILGIPTLCGPHMDNFQPLLGELVAKDGAIQVSSHKQLIQAVDNLLRNPDRAQQIGKKGQYFLETKTGATHKTSKVILHHE